MVQDACNFHFPYTEQEELFLAHALYECRFYKDGAADRARDMQMHVAVTGFLTQVGKRTVPSVM